MTTPILLFQNIAFGYQSSRPILKNANFSLHPGHITAIMGPNGIGKTTLLHLVLGWLRAWSGEIQFDGCLLDLYPRRELSKSLALVPQTETSPFDYTVSEYVLMGRAPHLPPLGIPSMADFDLALHVLEQVGITALANQPIPTLSGGEHQLMLLARAIVQAPRLLLLDEPTAHLDLHNKSRLVKIMLELRSQGVSLLMSNHEPDVVLAVADDVLFMEPGGALTFGPQNEVLTADALSRIYQLPIRLIDVDGHKQVIWA